MPAAMVRPAHAAAPRSIVPAHDPRRLRNYEFSDLYLASYKSGVPMATQLRCPPSIQRQPDYGLSSLPPEAHVDAFELWVAVQQRWSASNWQSEFSITHDGVQYRCALIDSPGSLTLAKNGVRNLDEPKRVWCLRRLPSAASNLTALGMPKWLSAQLSGLGKERGLLLICGPFSSGKTVTAGALLTNWVETIGGVGVSLEDPIELPLAGQFGKGVIYQIQVVEDQFPEAIKNARRWNPRYLMLQEIRGSLAASELVHISTGGPMSLTTIHANSPVEALMSLSKFAEQVTGEAIARQMLASSIRGVLHQTLVNRQLQTNFLSVTGKDAHSIRHKIRTGKFEQIDEDLSLQATQRANGRAI